MLHYPCISITLLSTFCFNVDSPMTMKASIEARNAVSVKVPSLMQYESTLGEVSWFQMACSIVEQTARTVVCQFRNRNCKEEIIMYAKSQVGS